MKRDALSLAVNAIVGEFFETHRHHQTEPQGLYDLVLHKVENILLRELLRQVRGNQKRAAEILGINRNTLRKKVQELGIAPRALPYREREENY